MAVTEMIRPPEYPWILQMIDRLLGRLGVVRKGALPYQITGVAWPDNHYDHAVDIRFDGGFFARMWLPPSARFTNFDPAKLLVCNSYSSRPPEWNAWTLWQSTHGASEAHPIKPPKGTP